MVLVTPEKRSISSTPQFLGLDLELMAFLFWKNLRPLTWESRRAEALRNRV